MNISIGTIPLTDRDTIYSMSVVEEFRSKVETTQKHAYSSLLKTFHEGPRNEMKSRMSTPLVTILFTERAKVYRLLYIVTFEVYSI